MFVLRVSRSVYARPLKKSLSIVSGFLLTILLMSSAAYAVAIPPGPSCAATNTGLLDLNCPGGINCSRGGTFSAGETITFNLNIVGGPFTLTVSPGGGGVTNAINSTTFVYLVPADGTYTFFYNNTGSASITGITATCAGANRGADMGRDLVRHQVSNHWSAILGIYGEHRTPLPFQNAAPDDAFQDGTGTAPSITGDDRTVAFQGSVRGLIFSATDNKTVVEPAGSTLPKPQRWDLWIKGIYTDFDNDDTGSKGETYVLSAGLDYLLRNDLLVGIIGGMDGGDQSSGLLDTSSKVGGFIVGPYASLRLNKELTLYGRAAWGRATHKMRAGALTGRTKGDRVMLVASLKGTYWTMFPVRVTPDIAVHYVNEKVSGFTDSGGNRVPGTRVELGRLQFGGELGYRTTLENGYLFDPYISLHGLWDFANEGNLQLGNNLTAGQSDIRGRVGAGFILQTHRNSHINVGVQFDGIGSGDFESISAHARLVIPLD